MWVSVDSRMHQQQSEASRGNCLGAQVDLYENGTIAIVEAVSPELGNRVQRVRVQLPGTSSELLGKFRDKKVDFAAHSQTEDGGAVFLNLLGAPRPDHPLTLLHVVRQQRAVWFH